MSPPRCSAWGMAPICGRIQPAKSEAESGGDVDFTTSFYVAVLLKEDGVQVRVSIESGPA